MHHFLRLLLSTSLLVSGFLSHTVWAKCSLIIYAEGEQLSKTSAAVAVNHLRHLYAHLNLLTPQNSDAVKLRALIEKRQAKDEVDLFIITEGGASALSPAEVSKWGKWSNLRTVVVFAPSSLSLAQAWRTAGARGVVAHTHFGNTRGFYFARFVRRWAQGWALSSITQESKNYSSGVGRAIGNFLKGDSSPVMPITQGENLAINGVGVSPSFAGEPDFAQTLLPGMGSSLSAQEQNAIQLFNSTMPLAEPDLDRIPNLKDWFEQSKEVAWTQLHDLFPSNESFGLPTSIERGEEIWIDGEALKFFISSYLKDFGGREFTRALEQMVGLKLVRGTESLHVTLYFDKEFDYTLKDENQAKNFQLYSVRIPKAIRLELAMRDGSVSVKDLATDTARAVHLKVKIPLISDKVYFRQMKVDLARWTANVEAGIIGNWVGLVGTGKFEARKFSGSIDFWQSVAKNESLLIIPALIFAYFGIVP